jgi:hypothetical protein
MNNNIDEEFIELGKNQHIRVCYHTTKHGRVCNFVFNFDKNAFFDENTLTKYLEEVKKSQEKYLPIHHSEITNENIWVYTNLKFFVEGKNAINFDRYLEEINSPLKKEGDCSLDKLINKRLEKRDYENEVDQYLGNQNSHDLEKFEAEQIPAIEEYLEKRTQYIAELNDLLNKDQLEEFYALGKEYDKFLKNDFVPGKKKKETSIERFLDYMTIESDQKELTKLIETNDLKNIQPRHYEALPDGLVHSIKEYIKLGETQPKLLDSIYEAIGLNFIDILQEYSDIIDSEFLN